MEFKGITMFRGSRRLEEINGLLFRVIAVFGFVCGVWAFAGYAQEDAGFTQTWMMPTYYNPAASGEREMLRLRGASKMQWVGIQNAPRTFLISGDMPYALGGTQIGAGVNMVQESLGLFSNVVLNLQGSYGFKILNGKLAIGGQLGYFTSKFRGSGVVLPDGDEFHQPGDEAIPKQDLAGNSFDLGVGVKYTHKRFSAGLSVQHLLSPKIGLGNGTGGTEENIQYETELPRILYFTAEGNIPVRNTLIEMQPSLLIKSDLKDLMPEVALRARYNRMVSVGAGYRHGQTVSIIAGVEYRNFVFGYSYDHPMSALSRVTWGSHELTIGYMVKIDLGGENRNRHKSVRFM